MPKLIFVKLFFSVVVELGRTRRAPPMHLGRSRRGAMRSSAKPAELPLRARPIRSSSYFLFFFFKSSAIAAELCGLARRHRPSMAKNLGQHGRGSLLVSAKMAEPPIFFLFFFVFCFYILLFFMLITYYL